MRISTARQKKGSDPVRVITGLARGRKLSEPADSAIRPTTDMVKEAIFNIIQFDVEGRKVLDLFAGTGQLGIEALSRGAESCVFIDESAAAVKLIEKNLAACELKGGKVSRAEALAFLGAAGKFDLIFLDPPYGTGLLEKALERIQEFDKLNHGGIIISESPSNAEPPELSAPYCKLKSYRYGKIRITTYTKRDN
ncbi:MAG: 16S rRNA (guanine(966)-N(2))-methyltransferase RsmD [Oscillospiraceae bacterium]|nr:16S rRNA (guanine(966)-N(2))-methyltransferase RsmD [Oscillospiraceae bacterium]